MAVLLLLLAMLLPPSHAQRAITVTTANWKNVLQGLDATVGPLQAGDVITFPGSAASPTVYSTTSRFGVSWTGIGTAALPLVVQAQNIGGAVITMATTGQNLMDIDRGAFFQIKGLRFTGGDLGLRLGTGAAVTDTVTDALFEDIEVTGTQGTLISANSVVAGGVKVYDRVTFRRVHLHHPLNAAGTNECMYLGANVNASGQPAAIFQNGLIEYVHCHDTLPAAAGFGAGVQLKAGANNNIVRFSTFYNVLIGPFLYDNFDLGGVNRVYGNVVWGSTDNCIQATAGSEIAGNVCFDSGNNGIQIAANQVMPGSQCRNHRVVGNTVIRLSGTPSASRACFRAQTGTTMSNIVVANNAFLCDGAVGSIVDAATLAANTFANNAVVGTASSITSIALSATTTAGLTLNSGTAGDRSTAWPRQGVSQGLTGRRDTAQGSTPDSDFNCVARTNPGDIGAYESQGGASNPGWAIATAMRDASLCPPATGSTSTSTTTTSTTSTSTSTTTGSTTSTTTGSSTSTSTSTATTTTPPSGGTTPPCPSSMATGVKVPCLVYNCALLGNQISWTLRMDIAFSDFDCPAFLANLASRVGSSALEVHQLVSGSTVIQVFSSNNLRTAVDNMFTSLANGQLTGLGSPVLSGVDPSGRTVVPPSGASGLPLWIIIAAAVGGLLLIAAIVLLVIFLKRRRSQGQMHAPLLESSFTSDRYEPVTELSSVRTAVAPVAPVGALRAVVMNSMQGDKAQNTLGITSGESLSVLIEDWDAGGEWVWASTLDGLSSGYVPRSYLNISRK